jgi:type II secretory ATPase GspE/PulE/Tfp pilus assembly ATPase PilB-like protein
MNGLVKEGSIGAVLFKSQIITEDELRGALEEQKITGCRVGEALVAMGVVTQEDIDWALANQLNIPYVRLKRDMIDKSAVALVPAAISRRYNLIPLFHAGDELSIAIADPLNSEAIKEVAEITSCQVTVSVGLLREIREMQDLFYGASTSAAGFGFSSRHFNQSVLDAVNADLTGSRLLDYLLLTILQRKLSSLSLQPLVDHVIVSGRSSGISGEIGRLAVSHYPDLLCRIRKIARFDSLADVSARGKLGFKFKGKTVNFHVLMLRGTGGEYVTLKLHIAMPLPATMAEIELSDAKAQAFRSLAAPGRGMLLFSMRDTEERCRLMDMFIDESDTQGKTVMLLGERFGRGQKKFPRIPVQHGYGDDIQSLTMSALEHDPDILAIEDITEGPAFIAASKAVMRGKMVVAGISFSDKSAVLKHLLYFRHKNYFIPTYVRGIISCKGVRTLCHHCREQYIPHPDEITALRLSDPGPAFYRAPGCAECDHTGFSGIKYLLDIIPFDKGILETFELFRDSAEIIRCLKDKGYRGITEEGIDLLRKGDISPGEYVASILL